jgi:hypothetical protein
VHGGSFAAWDDGNPAWEDIEYDSEQDREFEEIWKNEERNNQEEEVEHVPGAVIKKVAYGQQRNLVKVCNLFLG